MTPDERRARVDHVAKMAEQGFIVEPPEDRAEWERQFARAPEAAPTDAVHNDRKKRSSRRSA